ncbi:TolC family protein [Massilia sp. MB5]|uniref:TolC family protein n=1 Tax=Massilia sp. MB5 TaxID=2919578 RepID=UPI001F0F6D73|nr:TolC family protein [Massilia sp. MB5]UMR30460.1 TolC family protein [Massilia sp. MB5]
MYSHAVSAGWRALILGAFALPVSSAMAAAAPSGPATGGSFAATSANAPGANPAAGSVAYAIPALTLQAALNRALQANPGLNAARHEVLAQDGAVLQAGARPNPTLSLDLQDRRRETRETTWQLSQPLELGGKRAARVAAAERGREYAAAGFDAQRTELHAQVVGTFYDVLITQERLRLAQDALQLAKRASDTTARRVAAGKVSPVEETRARVAESGVRLEQSQAAAALATARQRLAAIWAAPAPDFEQAEGRLDPLPEIPDAAMLAARRSGAPNVQVARRALEQRKAESQLALANRAPDVTLSLGVKRAEEMGRNQALLGFSVPLPLFDRNRGNVLESAQRASKAEAELNAATLQLDSELAQAVADLSTARETVAALRNDILPGAISAYDAATKGFEYGKLGFIDVLDAQRTLLQVRAQHLNALADGHRAAAAIERLLGHASFGAEH